MKILQRFGCESVGFMDEFHDHSVILAFRWRGRNIQLKATAQGWANAYLWENPWTSKRHQTKADYAARALAQGMIAVNSILRDWVKGQVTAIETGILTFDHVFMPFAMLPDGRTLVEYVTEQKLLEAPA